ncbi:hypothetical protein IAE22_33920, partial [Bacillus sp. S34]|nr:hypothetical protein [Bacillus sp. S34]
YAITDAGRAELDARADEIAEVENGVNDSVKSLADGVRASVGEAMRSLRADLAECPGALGRHVDGLVGGPAARGLRARGEVGALVAGELAEGLLQRVD